MAIQFIEVVERKGAGNVIIIYDENTKPKFCFRSTSEIESTNVAKALAKQYKVLTHYTKDTKVFDTIKPDDEPPLVEG